MIARQEGVVVTPTAIDAELSAYPPTSPAHRRAMPGTAANHCVVMIHTLDAAAEFECTSRKRLSFVIATLLLVQQSQVVHGHQCVRVHIAQFLPVELEHGDVQWFASSKRPCSSRGGQGCYHEAVQGHRFQYIPPAFRVFQVKRFGLVKTALLPVSAASSLITIRVFGCFSPSTRRVGFE